MEAVIHTLNLLLAGVWLGGVVFTTAVVSPALKAMAWDDAERVRVRSVIGRYYAPVAMVNLALLLIVAVLDGFMRGWTAALVIEYAMLVVLFALSALHGAYFGPRLQRLAVAQAQATTAVTVSTLVEQRHAIQRISLAASCVNLASSVVLLIAAANL